MTLTKAELSDLLFEKLGLNKTEAKDFVETFFEQIRDCLEKGEDVKLSGFGNFQLRNKKIGRAHVRTPVTEKSRMPSSA